TGISKILGLCEVIDDHGGQEDVYRLAQDLHMPFAELLLVVTGAEMLGLVATTGASTVVTELGKQGLSAPLGGKKARLKEQMLKLQVFQHSAKLLQNSDDNRLPAPVIVEQLAVLLPAEQPRQLFTTLLNWGRYGDIFGYARDTDLFFLVS